jgi:nucleotide-binding universal stress UspA family protein
MNMASVQLGARFALKNILYLTDFSEPSEAVLPFATAIAREYGSTVYAFHVMIPQIYTYMTPDLADASLTAQEEAAQAELQRIASHLAGLSHECIVERAISVWPTLERAIKDYKIDLIVLGTHGRTGAQKLLMGSVAEEVFRQAHVPVLTVGPLARRDTHKSAQFRNVLFAADFSPASVAAAPYAISMAQENQARLLLLHVMKEPENQRTEKELQDAVSSATAQLHELVPESAEAWCKPETIVLTGNPADKILEAARERHADLIVVGLHDHHGHLAAATHLARTTAHKIVANATCPVLTVKG